MMDAARMLDIDNVDEITVKQIYIVERQQRDNDKSGLKIQIEKEIKRREEMLDAEQMLGEGKDNIQKR